MGPEPAPKTSAFPPKREHFGIRCFFSVHHFAFFCLGSKFPRRQIRPKKFGSANLFLFFSRAIGAFHSFQQKILFFLPQSRSPVKTAPREEIIIIHPFFLFLVGFARMGMRCEKSPLFLGIRLWGFLGNQPPTRQFGHSVRGRMGSWALNVRKGDKEKWSGWWWWWF